MVDELLQYRSKILGPNYAHKTRLRVKHARVCVFDTRMRYAQKTNSLVFMSWPIVVVLLLVLMAVCCIHVNALAIQLNMFRDCYGSQVNMATTDILHVAFTHLSKSPAKSEISIWSLSSESKKTMLSH